MRAATLRALKCLPRKEISIHAAHAGSDVGPDGWQSYDEYISIHAAHAGSDATQDFAIASAKISIHAAHAGSDEDVNKAIAPAAISIHAAQVGSDRLTENDGIQTAIFQSTLPKWAATVYKADVEYIV